LRERMLPKKPPPFPTMAQRAIHEALQRGSDVLTNEMQDRFDARMGIEGRYPFYDRRLIEFALALPEDQRWRDDQPKFILRRAMRALLPASLAHRKSKAEFSHLFREAIARESSGLDFASLRLCMEGYVDPGAAQDMHARCLRGELPPLGPVWMILALEFWYRMAFPADCASRG